MSRAKGQCFICERRVTEHSATSDGGEDAELETTVFLLRKVLQAPVSLLENFLKGTPCDCGMGVCSDCRPLLAECRAVHEELCQVKRRWSQVRTRVVNKMKVTAAPPEGEEVSRGDEDIRKETRRFVINHLRAVVVSESNLLASGQDNQRQPEKTQGREAESMTASHYVVIEPVLEEDANDDGDRGQVEEVAAPPPKKALIRRRRSQKQKIKSRVKKQSIAHQKAKFSKDCVFCPTKVPWAADLEKHLRVHTGERPFWCGVCGREFIQKGNLLQHRLIHSGEKSHECNLCPKRFARKGNLDQHVRSHLGEKPWKCPDCGKSFVAKQELTRHRVVHTRERPWKCDVCGKRFSQGSNLLKHKKRLHSGMVKVKSRK